MKKILIYLCFFGMTGLMHAQTALNDVLSKKSYIAIVKANVGIGVNAGISVVPINELSEIIKLQNTELVSINPYLKMKEGAIRKFIDIRSFVFIRKKYPLLSPIKKPILRNAFIHRRFKKKLNIESERVADYFARYNFISEGERIYLILSALEKVINITIENEGY